MPTINLEIEMYCETCGEKLSFRHDKVTSALRAALALFLYPCPTCTERKYSAGYDAGHGIGYCTAQLEKEPGADA